MSGNPVEAIRKACDSFGHCLQTNFSRIFPAYRGDHLDELSSAPGSPASSSFSFTGKRRTVPEDALLQQDELLSGKISTPLLTKEELGRSTWTLLHTVAAQMAILSRLYPCKECADHFKDVLKANPVQVGSQAELSQWLCHVHNVVNRSLGKRIFPCQRVNARWGKLDCADHSCDLQANSNLNYPF
ncbi:FAD-linked sulfhydryl oxidase ERV1 [Apostasia shenzhenica]|uniref:Sulfhydryl oxidase n=1 Tax=Apostasia shenzhenica TaxID=1088818 RepID=A0A2I0A2M2_9ASPA|nr:FAD-linked sulfhydryl oxidase ERV1 [Apostasia shenzhenica]